ncbi:MAG: hypothetical protein ABIQ15_02830 [Nocardioides sp.]
MSEETPQLAAALLGGAALLALIGWLTPLPRLAVALSGGLLGTAAVLAGRHDGIAPGADLAVVLVSAAGLLAVLGGGPLTTVVFDLVDRPGTAPGDTMQQAGEVLRGGAWIGALERLAAFAAVVSGWPEGLAIVLAVKGLARYPELRSGARSGIAERFIIGTFASVLWSLGCAGVTVLLLP